MSGEWLIDREMTQMKEAEKINQPPCISSAEQTVAQAQQSDCFLRSWGRTFSRWGQRRPCCWQRLIGIQPSWFCHPGSVSTSSYFALSNSQIHSSHSCTELRTLLQKHAKQKHTYIYYISNNDCLSFPIWKSSYYNVFSHCESGLFIQKFALLEEENRRRKCKRPIL